MPQKELRKAIKLSGGSQTKLAKKLRTTRASVNNWMNGGINIPGMKALKAEEVFKGEILAEKLSPKESEEILAIKKYFMSKKRQ